MDNDTSGAASAPTFPIGCDRTISGREGTVTLHFVWSGGPYIDVSRIGGTAQEVINVWDYQAGKPSIERTREGFEKRCTDWISEYGETGAAELVHDVMNNWR